MRRIALILLMMLALGGETCVMAGVDPGRVERIEAAGQKARKALFAEKKRQIAMTAGHIGIREEVEATTDFQREFNEYLDQFLDVLSISAELYGMYYEITKTSEHIKAITEAMEENPTGALAVAFSTRRNTVYRKLIGTSLDIIEDIRITCFKAKLTEKERLHAIDSVRPKMRAMNRQLTQLALMLKYTTFIDVWNEITDRYDYMVESESKEKIIARCRRRWRDNASSVR